MHTGDIKLWILGGFLGSGKTTLLNTLLAAMQDLRVGVVVNDFGTLGIDADLIEDSGRDEVIELNGGQIFCSCLSGSFVRSIEQLAVYDLDAILVESSGLAKPSALNDIIEQARASTEGKVRYCGFIGVVDAERFPTLIEVVNAVEEQVYYSDLLVINKTDLASPETLQQIREKVRSVNSTCPVIETVHGAIRPEQLPEAPLGAEAPADERFAGWGEAGRPKAVTWTPEEVLSEDELEAALRYLSDTAYRVKGYLTTREGPRFVSASGSQISIEPADYANGREGLAVIVPPRVITSKLFARALESSREEHPAE
jgi:G3E family GTPase